MDWLLENIAQAALAWSVGAVMGSTTTLGAQQLIKYFARRELLPEVDAVYMKFRKVCKPGTLDPEYPGNQEFMRADAIDSANLLIGRLRRAGFEPMPRCKDSKESLQAWFEFLERVRISLS